LLDAVHSIGRVPEFESLISADDVELCAVATCSTLPPPAGADLGLPVPEALNFGMSALSCGTPPDICEAPPDVRTKVNASDVGLNTIVAEGTSAVRSEKSSRFGEPVPISESRFAVAVVLTIALNTAAGVAVGLPCRYSAATPATCGDAMEVPLRIAVWVLLCHHALVMDDPGAKMLTQLPQLEKPDRASFDIVEPTVIAVGVLAGDRVQASTFSLPAATA
jgi:hypothetical protein